MGLEPNLVHLLHPILENLPMPKGVIMVGPLCFPPAWDVLRGGAGRAGQDTPVHPFHFHQQLIRSSFRPFPGEMESDL